jgi:hypothetical protein
VNCWVVLWVTVGSEGVMVIDCSAATVTVTEALTVPDVAVMVAVPPPTAVTMPVGLTVATLVFDELQVTLDVMSCPLPSL